MRAKPTWKNKLLAFRHCTIHKLLYEMPAQTEYNLVTYMNLVNDIRYGFIVVGAHVCFVRHGTDVSELPDRMRNVVAIHKRARFSQHQRNDIHGVHPYACEHVDTLDDQAAGTGVTG